MIPVENIADEVRRRFDRKPRRDLTTPAAYSLPGSLQGRVAAAAEWAGVTRSGLVTLILEDAMDDFAVQFEKAGIEVVTGEDSK